MLLEEEALLLRQEAEPCNTETKQKKNHTSQNSQSDFHPLHEKLHRQHKHTHLHKHSYNGSDSDHSLTCFYWWLSCKNPTHEHKREEEEQGPNKGHFQRSSTTRTSREMFKATHNTRLTIHLQTHHLVLQEQLSHVSGTCLTCY